jgi:hypothetical protein
MRFGAGAQLAHAFGDAGDQLLEGAGRGEAVFVLTGADAPVVDDQHAVDARLFERGFEHRRRTVKMDQQVVRLLRSAAAGGERDDSAAHRDAAPGRIEPRVERSQLLERHPQRAVELGARRLHQPGAELRVRSLTAELADDQEVTESDGCENAHRVHWL